MKNFRRSAPAHEQLDQVRQCINDAFPAGPDEARLSALICCARRRYKGDYQRKAIAGRARITVTTVNRIIGGDYTGLHWDTVEAVLKAVAATPADIQVAVEVFDRIRAKPTAPPPPVVKHNASPGPDAFPIGEAPGPVVHVPGQTTLPMPIPDLELAGEQPQPPEPVEPARPAAETTGPPAPDAPEPTAPDAAPEEPDQEPPDPSKAQTIEQYVAAIRRFRISKGEPTYRDMAKISADSPLVTTYSTSALNTIGDKGRRLPKVALVRAYVFACGGDQDDIDRWEKARTNLALRLKKEPPEEEDPQE
jgi:hypothetical protein